MGLFCCREAISLGIVFLSDRFHGVSKGRTKKNLALPPRMKDLKFLLLKGERVVRHIVHYGRIFE